MQHFTSLHDFLMMGGYAKYVWSAYGVTLIVLGWNAILPWQREKHDTRS